METACACLLPSGSATESLNGISHLFEHLFLATLRHRYRNSRVTGHTSEDYIIIFCQNLNPGQIMDSLRHLEFAAKALEDQKEILLYEIEGEASNPEEFFFRFVWAGSDYEKSPLGNAQQVSTLNARDMIVFKKQLLEKPIFFYNTASLEIIMEKTSATETVPSLKLPAPGTWKKNNRFRDKFYDIYYFNRDSEAFYLLERILKQLNSQKHVQLSEKREMSALILEKGVDLPARDNLQPLKESAFKEIRNDLASIRASFNEKALNELESVYFYNRGWEERISRLFQTTDRHLLGCLSPPFCDV